MSVALDHPGVMAQIRDLRVRRGFSETGIVRQTGLSLDDVRLAIRRLEAEARRKPGTKLTVDDAHVATLTKKGLSNAEIATRLGVQVGTIQRSQKRIKANLEAAR